MSFLSILFLGSDHNYSFVLCECLLMLRFRIVHPSNHWGTQGAMHLPLLAMVLQLGVIPSFSLLTGVLSQFLLLCGCSLQTLLSRMVQISCHDWWAGGYTLIVLSLLAYSFSLVVPMLCILLPYLGREIYTDCIVLWGVLPTPLLYCIGYMTVSSRYYRCFNGPLHFFS